MDSDKNVVENMQVHTDEQNNDENGVFEGVTDDDNSITQWQK